jgi:hypothetical protein
MLSNVNQNSALVLKRYRCKYTLSYEVPDRLLYVATHFSSNCDMSAGSLVKGCADPVQNSHFTTSFIFMSRAVVCELKMIHNYQTIE